MASNSIQIGHYNVLQTIGEGSFGKVKLAVHSITGNKVALKIINRKKIAHMDMVGRVKREIQYLKLLRHPHIIKLYEVITTPTDIIMVIEYAGRELFDYIVSNGKMPEATARKFFQQMVCAMEYCHKHKIVHRDLKPENLLLDPFDNVKIADFGLSNIMSDGNFLKTSCGSPNYAAPEVIGGKLYAGPEVDIWSCGVILYVMLCGRLPFDDEYIPHLFKKISEGIFSLPTFLSNEAKHLLSCMLVVDPLQRITISGIRQHPWFLKDLPEYLCPLPDTELDEIDTIDDEAVSMLGKKMNLDNASIKAALEHPNQFNTHIKVAYQLVLDHKLMLEHAQQLPSKDNNGILQGSSPPGWNISSSARNYQKPGFNGNGVSSSHTPSPPVEEDEDAESNNSSNTIRILSSSLPQNTGSYLINTQNFSQPLSRSNTTPSSHSVSNEKRHLNGLPNNNITASIHTGSKRKARSKWHFGIRSRNSPMDVMLEIYRALKQLNMDWKPFDPFHLRCRYFYPTGLIVKIELQLYRLDNQSYLVDFKNVTQSQEKSAQDTTNHSTLSKYGMQVNSQIYPFFDVCTKLITELAVSG